MIAVVVPDELAGDVAAAIALWLRQRGAYGHGPLVALAQELTAVSARRGQLPRVEPDPWLTSRMAAVVHGVSPRTITRWCQRGRVEAKREGNRWLVRS